MMSVANKAFMLSVIMLNVIMLKVIMLSVIMLSVVTPLKGAAAKIVYNDHNVVFTTKKGLYNLPMVAIFMMLYFFLFASI
jgi:hypothetical protein